MKQTVIMALKAVRHSYFNNLFYAVGLAAVLTPLLVLYGLKTGIVSGLVTNLKSDPTILQITLFGARPLNDEDVERIRAYPETGFALGSPRTFSSRVLMRKFEDSGEDVEVRWSPTALGDPLIPENLPALEDDEIIITEDLKNLFSVDVGDFLHAIVYRNKQTEYLDMKLRIVAVLPDHVRSGRNGLVSSGRIDTISAFADNYDVAESAFGGKPLENRAARYDSLRLYAHSLEAVAPLERRVAEEFGFQPQSKSGEILWVEQLAAVMTGVFTIITLASIAGYGISLWATVAGGVRANRSQFSLLRLLGMSRLKLWTLPLVQVLCVATVGLVLAFALSLALATILNLNYLAEEFNNQICVIRVQELAVAAIASYAIAVLVALQQLGTLQQISPTEALAEDL